VADQEKRKHLRVRCTLPAGKFGFYRGNRVPSGMVFTLDHDKDFSTAWMEDVPEAVVDELAEKHNPQVRAGNKRTSRDIPALMPRDPAPVKGNTPAPQTRAQARNDESPL
jgi:hypothetical protein